MYKLHLLYKSFLHVAVKCNEIYSRPDISTCQGLKNKLLFLFFFSSLLNAKKTRGLGICQVNGRKLVWHFRVQRALFTAHLKLVVQDMTAWNWNVGSWWLTGQDRDLHFTPPNSEALSKTSLLCIFSVCIHVCAQLYVGGHACMCGSQRLKSGVFYDSLPYGVETRSTEPRADPFARLTVLWALKILVYFPALALQKPAIMARSGSSHLPDEHFSRRGMSLLPPHFGVLILTGISYIHVFFYFLF